MTTKTFQQYIIGLADKEKEIFWSLFGLFLVLLFSYGVLVNSTIANGVRKERIDRELSSLSAKVSSLEFQYLNAKNSITAEYASERGFIAASKIHFAKTGDTITALSVRD